MYDHKRFAAEMRDMIYSGGGPTEHRCITEAELRELAAQYEAKVHSDIAKYQALYGVNFVPQNSAWTEFAKLFKVGAADLDKLALKLGIQGGYSELELFFAPRNLLDRFREKFLTALKAVSGVAGRYNDVKLTKLIETT